MTRVLVVEPAGNLWGSERALLDFLAAWPKVDIAVCCPPGTPIIAKLETHDVLVLPFFVAELHRKNRWARLCATAGLLRACLTFRPDVIHLNQAGCFRITAVVATMLHLPIVTHVRIFEDAAYLARCFGKRTPLRAIIAVSRAVEREVRQFTQLATVPVCVLYDAYVQTADSRNADDDPDRIERAGRIACVGRIVPIKGQDILVQAIEKLCTDGHDVSCVMIGGGEAAYVARLKDMARAGAADGAIDWPGNVTDVPSLLRACEVLACPSRQEPLGRVIFEAWDAGAIPVASEHSGGAAEIIRAAEGGILYAEHTADGLADALLRALSLSEGESARIIQNGRAWLAVNCDPARYAEAFSGVMESVTSGKPVQN